MILPTDTCKPEPVVWTPQELADYDFQLPQFIVEPVIIPGSITVLYGPREAGKTQIGLTLARDIQTEGLFLGRFKCSTARVGFVEIDMPATGMQQRIRAALSEFEFDAERMRIATPHVVNIMNTTADAAWVRKVNEIEPQFVVIDSLRKAHRFEEVDTGAPVKVYTRLQELFPDAAFLLLHHVRKPPPSYMLKGEKYSQRDDPESYRGTTAWLDDADAAIHVHLDPIKKVRSFRVSRARYADDSIKEEIVAYRIVDGSMFVEPTDPLPEHRLREWALASPTAQLKDAVDWLGVEYPNMANRTRYRVAHRAGFGKQK